MEGSLLDGTLRATVPKTIDFLGEFPGHDGTNGGGVLCFVMGHLRRLEYGIGDITDI